MNDTTITIGMCISIIFAITTLLLYFLKSGFFIISISISLFGIILITIGTHLDSTKSNKKEKK